MNAQKVLEIQKQYQSGIISLVDASFCLIVLGASPEEVRKILGLDSDIIVRNVGQEN